MKSKRRVSSRYLFVRTVVLSIITFILKSIVLENWEISNISLSEKLLKSSHKK